MKRTTGYDRHLKESHIYGDSQIEEWRSATQEVLAPIPFAEWLLAKSDDDIVGYAASVDGTPLAAYLKETAKLPATPWVGLAGYIKLQASTLPPPPEGVAPTPDIYLVGGSMAGSRSPYLMPEWVTRFESSMDRLAREHPDWRVRFDVARNKGQKLHEMFPVTTRVALELLVVAVPALFQVFGLGLHDRGLSPQRNQDS